MAPCNLAASHVLVAMRSPKLITSPKKRMATFFAMKMKLVLERKRKIERERVSERVRSR